jgi:hypothetical protein
MSKIYLAMRGTATPFKLPKQKGAHLFWQPLDVTYDGGGAEKVITF